MPESTPLIAEEEPFVALAQHFATCRELAIDTEANSLHAYREQVCLIQMSARFADGSLEHAIVDPLAIHDLSPLSPIFADPSIRKILHGSSYDILCLRRDFEFHLLPVFDTMVAAQLVGLQRFGLADLVRHYFDVNLDKRFQKCDWGARPLSDEQRLYAILDTYYLHGLYDRLREELSECGRGDQMAEEMELLEQLQPPVPLADIDRVRRMKGASRLNEAQLKVLQSQWRTPERHAKRLARATIKVMSNQDLLLLACDQPTTKSALRTTLAPRSPAANRFAKDVMAAIRDGQSDDTPIPPPPVRESNGRLTRGQERQLTRLKQWRNHTSKEEGVPPGMVANNDLLHHIALAEPADHDALAAVAFIRRWQLERHGEAILKVLHTKNG